MVGINKTRPTFSSKGEMLFPQIICHGTFIHFIGTYTSEPKVGFDVTHANGIGSDANMFLEAHVLERFDEESGEAVYLGSGNN